MTPHIASLAMAILLLGKPADAAASECTVLNDAEVARVFGRVGHHESSAAGSCIWKVGDDAIAVQVLWLASAAEARAMFDGWEREIMAPLNREASKPKIGQKAAAGMSAPGSAHPLATAIVLDREWLTLVSYMARSGSPLTPALLDKVVYLARQANAQAADSGQSIGSCEWFSKEEAAALLGTTGITIRRLGPALCIASSSGAGAALMAAVPEHGSAEASEDKRRNDDQICSVTPLPDLGAEAYVAHACTQPGKAPLPDMQGHVMKNGRHAEITYIPGDRPAKATDLPLLLPILRRALGVL